MPTFVIGFHDGWQHYPVTAVVADEPPLVNDRITDSLTGWSIRLDESDHANMDEHGITALEHVVDLACDGSLTDGTGLHEPYSDGGPRWEGDPEIMRRWRELGAPGSLN